MLAVKREMYIYTRVCVSPSIEKLTMYLNLRIADVYYTNNIHTHSVGRCYRWL